MSRDNLDQRKQIDFDKKLADQIPRGKVNFISYETDTVQTIHDIATFEVPLEGEIPKRILKYVKGLRRDAKDLKEIDINLDLFVEYRLTDKE